MGLVIGLEIVGNLLDIGATTTLIKVPGIIG